MDTDKNYKIFDTIIEKQNGKKIYFQSFSGGKDSLATFLRAYESGRFEKYILYFYYLIPEISWIDDYLQYFQEKFNVEVVQVPNPVLYDMIHNVVYQTPLRHKAYEKLCAGGLGLPKFNHEDLMRIVQNYYGETDLYCAVGVKSSDSMMRKVVMNKYGSINDNNKKYYPIHDMTNKEIVDILKYHDLALPEDYDLFGLSFDGLDYRFLKPIKDKKPEDYEKIKQIFPLIDLKISQQEKYQGYKIKQSKFMNQFRNDVKIYYK